MIDRFFQIRTLCDARNVRDCGVYFAKYLPATGIVAYTLHLEMPQQLSGVVGFLAAGAVVIFGVEMRAGMRRFAASRRSRLDSEPSATPFPNT